jgi:hypothetical protein
MAWRPSPASLAIATVSGVLASTSASVGQATSNRIIDLGVLPGAGTPESTAFAIMGGLLALGFAGVSELTAWAQTVEPAQASAAYEWLFAYLVSQS